MSTLFTVTIILILLTILTETIFLILQLKGKRMTKWFGVHAFMIHATITIFFWGFSFFLIFLLQFEMHEYFHNNILIKLIGLISIFTGFIIAVWGFKKLGLKRSLCINFYNPQIPVVKSSLYKYIKNPEDYGLWIMLLGFALFTASVYNLVIAFEFIILMIPHQRIENIPLKENE
ncbi:MAG: methyltransferase [Promethearchaeota archaeon]